MSKGYLIALGAVLCLSRAGAAPAARAMPADSGADMVGVNTHFNYYDRIYTFGYEKIVRPRLLESGIRHIRDGLIPGDTAYAGKLKELAAHGIHALLIHREPKDASFEVSRDTVKALNAGPEKPVEMVEGPNERDNSGAGWEERLRATTIGIWNALKSDPATKSISVVGPSFANTRDSAMRLAATAPGMEAYMDFGNLHSYSGGNPIEGPLGGGWGTSLDNVIARNRKLSAGKPFISTECGFHNAIAGGVPGHFGVTELAAAKYMPRLFLTYLKKGIRRTYLYEFIDEGTDPKDMEANFGLVRNDGTPKAQFTAVQSFIRLLSDPGPAFRPGSLAYRLEGDTTGIETALLEKRDGRFYLALWQAVASYDPATKSDLNPPERRLTLRLDQPAGRVTLYRPSTDGTRAVGSFAGGSAFPLSVPDHVLLVEIHPAKARGGR